MQPYNGPTSRRTPQHPAITARVGAGTHSAKRTRTSSLRRMGCGTQYRSIPSFARTHTRTCSHACLPAPNAGACVRTRESAERDKRTNFTFARRRSALARPPKSHGRSAAHNRKRAADDGQQTMHDRQRTAGMQTLCVGCSVQVLDTCRQRTPAWPVVQCAAPQ